MGDRSQAEADHGGEPGFKQAPAKGESRAGSMKMPEINPAAAQEMNTAEEMVDRNNQQPQCAIKQIDHMCEISAYFPCARLDSASGLKPCRGLQSIALTRGDHNLLVAEVSS